MGNLNNRQTQSTANGIGCARLLIGSIGGLALLITLAALIGRGANDTSACLRLTDPFLNVGMIDLHSGTTIGLSVPPLTPPRQYQWALSDTAQSSPDGRFTAYLGNILNPDIYILNLRPPMTTNRYQTGRSLGIMPYGSTIGWYVWSPDSQWLAYAYIPRDSTDQHVTIFVSAAHADTQASYALKVETHQNIQFYGWSADSKYLALSAVESDGITYHLYVWSLPTLQLVASRIYLRPPPDTNSWYLSAEYLAQWSPRGHTLAYLTQSAAVPSVVLMPLDSPDITYALPNNDFTTYATIPPMIIWSPDSSHVAITGMGKQGYHLDLVNIDGASSITLSDGVAQRNEFWNYGPNDHLPIVFWSADSQSLYYMNNSGDLNDMTGDFLAYRLKTKHTDVLASNVFNNLQQTPNHDYVFIAWAQSDQLYTGVVRTADGKLLDAQSRGQFSTKDRLADMYVSWAVKDKWLLLNPWDGLSIDPETWLLNVETGERRPVKAWGTASPDGTLVATVGTTPGSAGGIVLDKLHIENVEMASGRDIALNHDESYAEHPELAFIWSSDSKYIAVMYSTPLYASKSIQIVTLATGAIAEYHTTNFYPDKYSFTTCH